MADRDRCAAGAEDERLFPRNVHADFLKQPRKAERVGVVAGEPSCTVYDRVDASDGRGLGRYFVKQRHDGLFVGDRDVQAVKCAGFQKTFELLRLFFVELVLIGEQLVVNLGRVAVAELTAEKSAAQHQITSL